uniref:Related to MTR2-mRNA export protein n=1 Tax=Melanopsichium pennsylvanicum 4 TaxID=1398559 RepID=A0A077R9T2_9BASI|nr:related to MTR2-mRNA export protein [Melanopsichium pennsylvanicum 4]
MAAPPISTIDTRPDSRRLADFAAKASETFVSAYYAASDSPQRTNLVPTLYLPNSSIVWNGTPVSGQQELTAMLNSMPGSKHEVQAFDSHALGGAVHGGGQDGGENNALSPS